MFGKGKQRRHAMKLQSAMEYLMTYGWAILIIAVVLGALFSLGVFGNLLGNHCVTTPGWSCISATLSSSTGVLTMDIGQATGSTIYIQGAACSTTASSSGFPAYGAVGVGAAVSPTPTVNNNALTSPQTVTNGQTFTLAVPCYTSSSAPSYTLGQAFTGFVWLNYTLTPGGSAIIAQITTSLTEKAS
ncbi:MAG: hypothetical protein M1603_03100 [Candidatus Marsarchaeota archaeon]|nr:hypothetical protein [Candidatus Marsarchaeota archaeon]